MLGGIGGLEVSEACGGREAINLLSSKRLDLVLLDLAMPGLSGYDVLSVIRAQDVGRPRVVLMTGFGVGEDQMPVFSLSLESAEGFAAPRCFDLANRALRELSRGLPRAA
jgi:CheY-like chemotaxis protein